MKNNRRNFIKMSGIAGLGIAGDIMNGYASESIKFDDLNLNHHIENHQKIAVMEVMILKLTGV